MSDLKILITVVAILITLILLLRKIRYKSPTIGALLGFAVWLADYDFLLNFTGTDTTISDWIFSLFSVEPWKIDTKALLSLFFLMFLGALFGLIGLLFEVAIKKHK